jgi:hypothetical protein
MSKCLSFPLMIAVTCLFVDDTIMKKLISSNLILAFKLTQQCKKEFPSIPCFFCFMYAL